MTKPNLKPWCEWQVPCCDFDGFACMASSASGHVFECTFRKDGKWLKQKGTVNGRHRNKPIHPTGGGVCEDWQPPEKE
jgi:hypothetical protein